MKKRISANECSYIGRANNMTKWVKLLTMFTLEERDNGDFRVDQKMKLLPYILLFIPVHLIFFLLYMFDGGLLDFRIQKRFLSQQTFNRNLDPEHWKRARNIWNAE